MKRDKLKRAAVRRAAGGMVAAVAAAVTVLPALAQDRDAERGGLSYTLGIDNRLEYTTNPGLRTPAEEAATDATTRLSFTLADSTPTQDLRITAAGGVRYTEEPGLGPFEFDRPLLRLSYRREAANAEFDIEAFWRQSEIAFQRPLEDFVTDLEDFVTDEGEIELPSDIDELFGGGTRINSGGSFRLQLGTTSPLGFVFDGQTRVLNYSDVTSTGLFDNRKDQIGAAAVLRFSENATLRAGARYVRYDADNTPQTLRQTRTVFVGYDADLSPILALTSELGYSNVETERFGTSTTVDGVEGNLGLFLAMPNGTATADLDAETDQTGTRVTFRAGRSLQLPGGSVDFALGATRPQDGDWSPVGEVRLRRDLPRGRIVARLRQYVSLTSDDTPALTTASALNYSHQINALSSFNFGLSYVRVDNDDTDVTTRRADVTARYSHALTEDWNMNVGINYRFREQNSDNYADSESVFVSLSRAFEWLQ